MLDTPTAEPGLLRGNEQTLPVCNGELLGFALNRYSCLEAWRGMPADSQTLTFGDRSDGSCDVKLPRRFSSCESAFFI